MVVTSVFLLADPITLTRLRATMEERFLLFDRFRQRIVKNLTGAEYEFDPDFDIANHVKAVPRGVVRGKRDLQRLAGRLAMQPLDPERPLWHMDLVRNYRGGSAAILRIHHCYADGIAMIQVLLAMTDANRSGGRRTLRPPKRRGDGSGRNGSFGAQLERAAGATLHLAEDAGRDDLTDVEEGFLEAAVVADVEAVLDQPATLHSVERLVQRAVVGNEVSSFIHEFNHTAPGIPDDHTTEVIVEAGKAPIINGVEENDGAGAFPGVITYGMANDAVVPYSQRFTEYQRTALESLDSLTVTPGIESIVRDYFTRLEP